LTNAAYRVASSWVDYDLPIRLAFEFYLRAAFPLHMESPVRCHT